MENGADEIDMVVNLGWVKEGRYDRVLEEINAVKKACAGRLLKVIIETCLLTEEEKTELCRTVTRSDAEFIKTSTGFGTGGATFEDVALMKKCVGDEVKIKAAGGNLKATGFTELEISLMGEDFGHIEDLLKEDFSDVGKKESDTFVATFTLPEEQHQRVNRYVEDYGKVGLAKAVMDKVKGLV